MAHKSSKDKNPTSRGDSTPGASKSLKRDFELVSPESPEGYITSASMRNMLKEHLQPISKELTELKKSVNSNAEKIDEIMNLKKSNKPRKTL